MRVFWPQCVFGRPDSGTPYANLYQIPSPMVVCTPSTYSKGDSAHGRRQTRSGLWWKATGTLLVVGSGLGVLGYSWHNAEFTAHMDSYIPGYSRVVHSSRPYGARVGQLVGHRVRHVYDELSLRAQRSAAAAWIALSEPVRRWYRQVVGGRMAGAGTSNAATPPPFPLPLPLPERDRKAVTNATTHAEPPLFEFLLLPLLFFPHAYSFILQPYRTITLISPLSTTHENSTLFEVPEFSTLFCTAVIFVFYYLLIFSMLVKTSLKGACLRKPFQI